MRVKTFPVFAGVILSVFLPVVALTFFPGNVSVSTGYLLNWGAVFIGGICASRADINQPFLPAMLTGVWAGAVVVLISPAREDLISSALTVAVYGFMAVCGARVRCLWEGKR